MRAYEKMLSTLPDFVAFNGRPNQYIDEPTAAGSASSWCVTLGASFRS
jgi:hypothetical protein